ncbi:MAG: cytochrome bc1 complex diheme cytochrome c subunit [Acidimicrobiales bacterium]
MLRSKRPRRRLLQILPGLVVVGAGVVGLLTTGASAASSSTTSTTTASSTTTTTASTTTTAASTVVVHSTHDPISYGIPSSANASTGQQLFESNCSSCHGTNAFGTDRAPNLVGLGAATVDFWVSTGRMPLAISSQQPVQKPARFDRQQTLDIAAFVASLSPQNGPAIPTVSTRGASLADGNSLFVLNCAACHTITGAGDALADGYFAPSLHKATKQQIAEAIRTGPGNMPRFSTGEFTDQQVADIVAYVSQVIQHPDNAGGLGLGEIGPVAEGFVALLIGVGGIMLVAFWLGDRANQ